MWTEKKQYDIYKLMHQGLDIRAGAKKVTDPRALVENAIHTFIDSLKNYIRKLAGACQMANRTVKLGKTKIKSRKDWGVKLPIFLDHSETSDPCMRQICVSYVVDQ